MKQTISIFLTLTTITMLAAGCRQTDIRTTVVNIPNAHNDKCQDVISKALSRLKGVDIDQLVFSNQTVTVKYDSMMLGTKNIEHAIKDAGFDANSFKADPAARKRLPKECLEN